MRSWKRRSVTARSTMAASGPSRCFRYVRYNNANARSKTSAWNTRMVARPPNCSSPCASSWYPHWNEIHDLSGSTPKMSVFGIAPFSHIQRPAAICQKMSMSRIGAKKSSVANAPIEARPSASMVFVWFTVEAYGNRWKMVMRCSVGIAVLLIALGVGCKRSESSKTVESSPRATPKRTEVATPAKRPEPVRPKTHGPSPDRLPNDMGHLVIDRLRAGNTKQLRISRGGRWGLVLTEDDVVQVFDAARGRLILERPLRPFVACRTQAFSPDGRRVLVRKKGRVQLLNLWTGDVVRSIGSRHSDRYRCSLSGEGGHAVVATPGVVTIYDLNSRKPKTEIKSPVTKKLEVVLTDAAARTIVVVGHDHEGALATVWGGDGGERWRRLQGFSSAGRFRISASGRWMLGDFSNGKGRLWRLWTGEVWPFQKSLGSFLGFSDNKDQVITYADGQPITVVDAKTGEVVLTQNSFKDVSAATVSAGGDRLLVTGGGHHHHRLGLWSLGDGRARFKRMEPRDRVRRVSYDQAGEVLRIDVDSGRTHAFQRATGKRVTLPGATRIARDMSTWRGRRMASGWSNRWRLRFGRSQLTMFEGSDGTQPPAERWKRTLDSRIVGAALSHDDKRVLVLLDSGHLQRLKPTDGKSAGRSLLRGDSKPLAIASHPKSLSVFVVNASGLVTQNKVQTGREMGRWTVPRLKWARVAVTQSGDKLAIAERYRVHILDLASKPPDVARLQLVKVPTFRIRSVGIAPGGDHLVLSDGIDVATWDVGKARRVATIVLLRGPSAIAVGLGGHLVTEKWSRPYVRWRKKLQLMPRDSHEAAMLWKARVRNDINL
jgi:hypothetical protein